MLTEAQIRTISAEKKQRIHDGSGLYLELRPLRTGGTGKYFIGRTRYPLGGPMVDVTVGSWGRDPGQLSLKAARNELCSQQLNTSTTCWMSWRCILRPETRRTLVKRDGSRNQMDVDDVLRVSACFTGSQPAVGPSGPAGGHLEYSRNNGRTLELI